MPTYTYPTDFAGTCWLVQNGNFYVSSTGNDSTGDGSPVNPYETIQKAMDVSTGPEKIVVGAGTYIENVDGLNKNNDLEGDGLVIIYGKPIGGAAFTNMGAGTSNKLINFQINGFASAIIGKIAKVKDCLIADNDIIQFKGVLENCVIQNALVNAEFVSKLLSCTLINVQNSNTETHTKFTTILDCHFDADCFFNIRTNNTLVFNYCNQEPGSTIRVNADLFTDVAALNALYATFQVNGVNVVPDFNKATILDYTLKASSALLHAGSLGLSIGAFGLGESLNLSTLGGAILTNVTISPNGKYILNPGSTSGQILTAPIDLGGNRVLGRVNLFAVQHFETPPANAVVDSSSTFVQPNKITFEMKWQAASSRPTPVYHPFIWNKQPTIDASGVTNGDPGFDSSTAQTIFAQFIAIRVTLHDESHLIIQEDGCLLLRENGRALLLEP